MKQFIEKMIAEETELNKKIVKADNVLSSNPYGIDEMGKHLLEKQVQAMKVYSDILHQRINYEVEK